MERSPCGNRILKAFANSLDPDETPQNVMRRHRTWRLIRIQTQNNYNNSNHNNHNTNNGGNDNNDENDYDAAATAGDDGGDDDDDDDDDDRWNGFSKAFANSLDPDETPQNVASHQDPNSDDILADDKLPSMQRVKRYKPDDALIDDYAEENCNNDYHYGNHQVVDGDVPMMMMVMMTT
ncbi:hypothetical protein DPMN_181357 [Dreissena polymorpha]|uniref:Uncharacterized protein n=1 Tax=Dreissena polymorpha TaxID=45954 RepID=A0A9D4DCQ1_DREPO|nr:hypothetical protein DPMN_181357 [Dreissena polymorpha]